MKKIKLFILSSIAICLCMIVNPLYINAKTTDKGQVTVDGGITFYEDSVPEKTESSTKKESKPNVVKNLPKTGEKMGNHTFMGMAMLLTLFVIYRKKKGGGMHNEKNSF